MKFQLKIVRIIQLLYSHLKSRVICGHFLSEEFEVNTGVKQGCILSPLLFTLSIDWLMRVTMQGRPKGIKWTFTEILDFADDVVLLSHRFKRGTKRFRSLYGDAMWSTNMAAGLLEAWLALTVG